MKFYDVDTEFTFGKYEGKTLAEVFQKDPKYIDYCFNNIDEFYVSPDVLKELRSLDPGYTAPSINEMDDETLDSFFDEVEELDEVDESSFDDEEFSWDDEDVLLSDDSFDDFDDDFEDDFSDDDY